MSSFHERLHRLYGGEKKDETDDGASWIPHRPYGRDDLVARLKQETPSQVDLGEARAQELLELQTRMAVIKDDFFEQVANYLLQRYGESRLEDRLTHFAQSWDDQYEKYGDDLIFALGQVVDDLNEGNIVNYDGYLNKKTAKELVRQYRLSLKQR